MTDNINILFIDYIGLYAPLILIFVSIFILQNKTKYLQIYIIGLILNNVLNAVLKYAIKEPRPSIDSRILEMAIANGERFGYDRYGMPSGHAQNCAYNLAFVTLVLNNSFITGLYLVISAISMYQRHKYGNHTILQLIIGFCVGLIFGYLCYYAGNKWLKGDLTPKLDDFAPK
jgi:membrane-associated phospholipid phosphatase